MANTRAQPDPFDPAAPPHHPAGPADHPADRPTDDDHGGPVPMIITRQSLPATRESITHKFAVDGHEGYLTIGLYEDGRPGEIFIKISKEGSALSGMCQAFCRSFSLALQLGLPLDEFTKRFRGMRFEPMGPTSNPDIPEAQSIVDYLARYLDQQFAEPKLRR